MVLYCARVYVETLDEWLKSVAKCHGICYSARALTHVPKVQ